MSEEVGRSLRRLRLDRGLTLKQVGERSAGTFKPTAVAGYERAERSISLEKFCELLFYGVAAGPLLAEIMEAFGARPDLIVDLTRFEDSTVAPSTDG